jgi:hypothetical protein
LVRRCGGPGHALESSYAQADIKFLDWGFQQNIYTITDGRLRTREIFGDATAERSGSESPWMEELREEAYSCCSRRAAPDTGGDHGVSRAPQEYSPLTRTFKVPQRDGETICQGIEVQPNTLSQGKAAGPDLHRGPAARKPSGRV